MKRSRLVCAITAFLALAVYAAPAAAQGVTTASMTGVVKDAQGAVIPGVSVTAVHEPSGTNYEAVTQADGRFTMPGMRVGGPYKITAALQGFTTEVQNNITLSLGVAQDLEFTLKVAAVSETITVVGTSDPVFSSSHTGSATAVMREDLAALPTISGRINDFARLSPQYSGSGTFVGQDNRANNITVDGSYFNNSFGLGGQPGDRTGVAPISMEAIEQVQVSVAPYDVRQGNFVGAGVNTVTRSGTNMITGSIYRRMRSENCSVVGDPTSCSGYVGTTAAGNSFYPGQFSTYTTGGWLGGPIVKNKLFAFGSYEKQDDQRPLTTFQSNSGNQTVAGNVTRVLASDLNALSAFLQKNFNYDTGPFDNIPKNTPAKPWMLKGDYNVNSANKVTFRYNQLDSFTDVNQSGSSSLGVNRPTGTTQFLSFSNSNYQILENIKSGIGEWNSVFGNMTNNLLAGYTHQDESRSDKGQNPVFPFVEIAQNGTGYTSFGNEPFTPANQLRYNTFQAQDSLTKFAKNHSWTFGGALEKYHSFNVFYPGSQSAYVYNSLADFYTDANGYLATQGNRTVAPVTLRRFQVRYMNIPGLSQPEQPLDVWYSSAYAQDEWRPKSSLTVTYGIRMDVAKFGNTAYDNPNADKLTFRDETGAAVTYNSGGLPTPHPLWSPRVGFNYDLTGDQKTQLRGGTGVFTGKPPYVWISNQIGNTGMLTGFVQNDNTTGNPFNPDPNKYKPTSVTGAPATSYELDVTDQDFRFPQTWRTNIGVDRRLPWGLVATGEFIANRDLNAPYYINANLPAPNGAFTGIDNRVRWATTAGPGVGTPYPTCASAGQVGPCVSRINNAPGNQVTAAYVIKNTSLNRSWNASGSITKPMNHGFSFKGGYTYGVAKSVFDPASTASSSYAGTGQPTPSDPNNPPLSYSATSPGHRYFLAATYSKQYLSFGATTVSMFLDGHTNGNTSYVFSGDANGDNFSGNDLIYIPATEAEMNFKPLTTTLNGASVTYTAQQQADAFEQYINNDPYLKSHRGQYAERWAVFQPIVSRVDLSITQDVFHSIGGKRHSGQIRLDITNLGNLLNKDWGVSQRVINQQILTNPTADAQGRLTYNLQTLNGQLLTSPYQTNAGISDVYVMMLSFRYQFN
ncbi:MAG TPA: carboxypeptidase regulatory-like domain-containing protein [Vicinamibacterales bacterium]|nr:carboxypeptidase regulatory-like domain-containing protein [Vicinamibacterales bacterium]